uniref:GFO/IDH/MocA-like oxidoreductase domain-containing protein n=1 Tax=Candidatus Kentrum sp. MB TaxID=2138164 RepID=A0A450XVU3_9GAMM|nr:MAG: hypothetical protein BECKMB1821G_GA0114241_11562 [Candidatus Kentron sp. MB]VFK35940.1 MAG: hypothetical protein BECKMB1821I_GA0114274_11662 [Candidatus Kentron sp. MB]VFK77574.1 MAG: hypothetical protein BECKMB1821H_GA0114242_11682 [Candidatus Kentron sp. MB]
MIIIRLPWELKDWIDKGRLGRLARIHIEMPQDGFIRLDPSDRPIPPQPWRLADGEIPTLSLDLGVHLHHIISFLSRERPLELVATQSVHGAFRQVVDNTVCIARYSNDLECHLWFSKAALGYRNGLKVRVFGELGAAKWRQMTQESFLYCDNRGRESLIDRAHVDAEVASLPRYNRFKAGHPAGFLEALANLYCDIADALVSGKQNGGYASEYVRDASHAVEGLVMLEAMTRSARTHGRVDIESA